MDTCSSSTLGGLRLLATLLLPLLPLLVPVCGKIAVLGKIMGGDTASEKRWPWHVSLWLETRLICGGSLIHSKWVITAAHCFRNSNATDLYSVLMGSIHLRSKTSVRVPVKNIFKHPNFSSQYPHRNDIALVELQSAVGFSEFILPVCLPTPEFHYEEKSSCWMTGWGALITSDFAPLLPPSLQEAQVSIIDSHSCNVFFEFPEKGIKAFKMSDDMLCAGDLARQKAICPGMMGMKEDGQPISSTYDPE
ncbi:serine protease 27-like [Monodelphis domestica]|uniref:serine protease 27-like n=1 Tax=Monodelphis domestica TaxID=13616 RepID=UPI0024E1D08A|nr:serine protease 27-like [Monodelphis domestica]